MKGIKKGDSDVIGFVISCLYHGTIDESEVKEWAVNVIGLNSIDDIPDYIFELLDASDIRRNIGKIMGFSASWKSSKNQYLALYGINIKRQKELFDAPVTPDKALVLLAKHPEVEKKFRETFPFIEF